MDNFGRKILEKLQNSQNWSFQMNSEHFSKKILEKLQNSMLIRLLDWCTWHRFLVPGYPGNEFTCLTFVHDANNADNDANNNNHGQKGDWL